VERGALARLAPARAPRARGDPGARARPEPRYRDEPALGRSTSSRRGFRGSSPTTRRHNVSRSHALRGRRPRVVFVCNLSPCPRRLPDRTPRGRALGGGAQSPTRRTTAGSRTWATSAASFAEAQAKWHDQALLGLKLVLPPLATIWLVPRRPVTRRGHVPGVLTPAAGNERSVVSQ
jgi:hypothetical protein